MSRKDQVIAKAAREEAMRNTMKAVQRHLDNVARSKGYDNIISLCTYATDSDPIFSAEGQAGVAWRGAVWRYCNTVLAEVEAGTRAQPTVEELIAELPTITWPNNVT